MLRFRSANPVLIGWSALILAALLGIAYELCKDMLVVPLTDVRSQRSHPEREGSAAAAATATAAGSGFTAASHAPTSWEHSPAPSAIPFILWQTYKTRELPRPAQDAAASWTGLNPDLASRLYSDPEAAEFMNRTLGAEVLAIYEGFPLGVMRADFFRYAILLDQGGIYADVDTACKVGMPHILPHQRL